MPLDIDKEMTFIRNIPGIGRLLEQAFRKVQQGVNTFGQNIAVDPTGVVPAPPPINQLDVKSSGTGLVHAVITDNNKIQKNLHYFVEYANEPNFLQPHVVHLGASRSMSPVTLPALDDNGNPQNFYFRAYSQYPGGKPGPIVHFGGGTPTAVAPGGTHQMTLLPSTGSGTAQASGQEGGSGFGKFVFRGPVVTAKRSAK
jgi:hypothetical protein